MLRVLDRGAFILQEELTECEAQRGRRGGEQGAQQSQALHAWFAHVPGLRVVMPATPLDARDLLVSAALCGDPVLYVDDRWLCDQSSDIPRVPDPDEVIAGVAERLEPEAWKSVPRRLTLQDAPAPTSKDLESAYYPTVERAMHLTRQVVATSPRMGLSDAEPVSL